MPHTYRQKRPDALARVRRQRRAPLPESERTQLARLAASMGPIAAARAVGVSLNTFKSALAGEDTNPSTREAMLASGWLLPSEGNPAP